MVMTSEPCEACGGARSIRYEGTSPAIYGHRPIISEACPSCLGTGRNMGIAEREQILADKRSCNRPAVW